MGALFGEQARIKIEDYDSMVSDSIDINAFAKFSALALINATFGSHTVDVNTFHSYAHERQRYSKGAVPPSNVSDAYWLSKTHKNPMPMKLRLASIDTLPIKDLVSASVITNLKFALSSYCPFLLEAGKLSSCDLPPKPRTWTNWVHDWHNTIAQNTLPDIQCLEGQYIEKMRWKQDRIHSIKHLRFKCSGKAFSYLILRNTGCLYCLCLLEFSFAFKKP